MLFAERCNVKCVTPQKCNSGVGKISSVFENFFAENLSKNALKNKKKREAKQRAAANKQEQVRFKHESLNVDKIFRMSCNLL